MFKHESSSRTIAAVLVDTVLCGMLQLFHAGSGIPRLWNAPYVLVVFFALAKQRDEVQGAVLQRNIPPSHYHHHRAHIAGSFLLLLRRDICACLQHKHS